MKTFFTRQLFIVIITIISILPKNIIAQNEHQHSHSQQLKKLIPSLPYIVYDEDSLSGFNEASVFADAMKQGFSEEDVQRYLHLRKQLYIKNKYGITPGSNAKTGLPTVQAPCTNIDFETGNTSGWTTSGDVVITSGAGNDPYGGFPVVAPGGNFSVKLGNATNPTTSIAKQTFLVSAANAYFVFKVCDGNFKFPTCSIRCRSCFYPF